MFITTCFFDTNITYLGKSNTNLITYILIKTEGTWKLGDYIWNDDMTEAIYSDDGMLVPISYLDAEGIVQEVQYQIPSNQDCISCHHNYDIAFPIGPKLRSMNFNPNNEETSINQLQHFINIGMLEGISNIIFYLLDCRLNF